MALSSYQKTCVAGLFFAFGICLTGYVAPYWEQVKTTIADDSYTLVIGLIFYCGTEKSEGILIHKCDVIDWNREDLGDYFKAVRILMGISLLFTLTSLIAGLVVCCKIGSCRCLVYSSVFAILGGLVGIAGVGTYAGFFNANAYTVLEAKAWAFYLSGSGAGLVLLIGILSLVVPKNQDGFQYEKKGIPNYGYQVYRA